MPPKWVPNNRPPNKFEDRLKKMDRHLVCRRNRHNGAWEILWDYGFEWIEGVSDTRYEHILTCLADDGSQMMPSDKQITELQFLDRAKRGSKFYQRKFREQEYQKQKAHDKDMWNESEAKARDDAHMFCVKGGFRSPYVRGFSEENGKIVGD